MPTDEQYVNAAKRLYDVDGDCEVDEYDPDGSEVASCDSADGAYVMAWVWVPKDEAEKE